MPRKIRELIADLEKHGFVNRGAKGAIEISTHQRAVRPIKISGDAGDDGKNYQQRAVQATIKEVAK